MPPRSRAPGPCRLHRGRPYEALPLPRETLSQELHIHDVGSCLTLQVNPLASANVLNEAALRAEDDPVAVLHDSADRGQWFTDARCLKGDRIDGPVLCLRP